MSRFSALLVAMSVASFLSAPTWAKKPHQTHSVFYNRANRSTTRSCWAPKLVLFSVIRSEGECEHMVALLSLDSFTYFSAHIIAIISVYVCIYQTPLIQSSELYNVKVWDVNDLHVWDLGPHLYKSGDNVSSCVLAFPLLYPDIQYYRVLRLSDILKYISGVG